MGTKVRVKATLNVNKKEGTETVAGRFITRGERQSGTEDLTYKIKEKGTIYIYYRFRISPKKLKTGYTVTPQVRIETLSGKKIYAFTKAGRKSRTVSFA